MLTTTLPTPASFARMADGARGFATSYAFAEHRDRVESLAEPGNYRPQVLYIGCSDAPCGPGLLTDVPPGSVYTVTNPGNLATSHGVERGGVAAACEFALSTWDITDIIVCGHSGCCAVAAALSDDPAAADWWERMQPTRDALRRANLGGIDPLVWAIQHNVLMQLHHLGTHPAVARRLRSQELRLHGWYFDTATGEVYEAKSGEFTKDVCAQFELL